jgi:hypothetical protein
MRNKVLKSAVTILLLNSLLLFANGSSLGEIDATTVVSWVHDGDSFNTTSIGEVRLADINASEMGELGYVDARDFLIDPVYNKTVYLDIDQYHNQSYRRDPHDRLVCLAYVGYNSTHYENVNEALLEEHHANISDYPNEFDPLTWTLYISKESIPEFLSLLIPALFILVTLPAVAFCKRRKRS